MNVTPRAALTLLGAAALLVVAAGGLARRAEAQRPSGGPTIEEVSYALGHDLGREIAAGLALDGVEPDVQRLVDGFADGLRNEHSFLDAERIEGVLVEFNRIVQQRKAEQRLRSDPVYRAIFEENRRKSAQFLERFAEKEGAKSLEGGIHYLVIEEEDGPSPSRRDTVVVTFRALLIDGLEIASGTNVAIDVDSMEEGFQRVVTAMDVGDHWYVAVPPELAFGEIGRPPDIGPNEVVVADVELLRIIRRPEALDE